ncbi:MAG: hypothetical protein ACRCWQ_11505, partial [Bacilli bacterium]
MAWCYIALSIMCATLPLGINKQDSLLQSGVQFMIFFHYGFIAEWMVLQLLSSYSVLYRYRNNNLMTLVAPAMVFNSLRSIVCMVFVYLISDHFQDIFSARSVFLASAISYCSVYLFFTLIQPYCCGEIKKFTLISFRSELPDFLYSLVFSYAFVVIGEQYFFIIFLLYLYIYFLRMYREYQALEFTTYFTMLRKSEVFYQITTKNELCEMYTKLVNDLFPRRHVHFDQRSFCAPSNPRTLAYESRKRPLGHRKNSLLYNLTRTEK